MRLRTLVALLLLPFAVVTAVERVSLSQLQSEWAKYQNQIVEITTPLVVCGNYYDSLILAPERLYCPEEKAFGLADGDSTAYWQIKQHNYAVSICVHCRNAYYDVQTGDMVKGLKARVTAPRQLVTGKAPRVRPVRKAVLPSCGKDELRIVGANIENYFADLGGYASRKTTPEQLKMKTRKLVKDIRQKDSTLRVEVKPF